MLVRQFRYSYRAELWEVPAGKLESGEEIIECAIRELREETGYTAGEMTYMGAFTVARLLNEKIHVYRAWAQKRNTDLDGDEMLRPGEFPFDKVLIW